MVTEPQGPHPDERELVWAKSARALLDVLGLDVHRSSRPTDRPDAEAIVGPTVRGWRVQIDLAAWDALVAPRLRAALDHEQEAKKR